LTRAIITGIIVLSYNKEAPLALKLGIARPYLEDELKILTKCGYLKESGGKYLTCVPIFTAECSDEIKWKLGEATRDAMQEYCAAKTDFAGEMRERFGNENLFRWQEYMLCCHEAPKRTEGLLDNQYGGLPTDGIYRHMMGGSGIIWG